MHLPDLETALLLSPLLLAFVDRHSPFYSDLISLSPLLSLYVTVTPLHVGKLRISPPASQTDPQTRTRHGNQFGGQGLAALKSVDLGHRTGLEDRSLTSSCPQMSHGCLLTCGSFGSGNAKALPYWHPGNANKTSLIWDPGKVLKLDCRNGYTAP